MQSKATTVSGYLKELPAERGREIKKVRTILKKNLPKGYKEIMQYGMITYVVPLSLYPKGYLGKKDTPLPYIALASQKNYMALYFLSLYEDVKANEWFQNEYLKSGKKLDRGKSCIRFKKVDDLPLELIGKTAALLSISDFIVAYEKTRAK